MNKKCTFSPKNSLEHDIKSNQCNTEEAHEKNPEDYKKWMKAAFELAEEALKDGEVPIGCVIVDQGEIIAKGKNATNATKNATNHCEVMAINDILASLSKREKNYKDVFQRFNN